MKDKTVDYLEELKRAKEEIPQIKEELAPYLAEKRQGEYTIEDYYALPDEHRVELIDGVIYDMSSPTTVHQMIIGELFVELHSYVRKNKGRCIVVGAPLDTQIDCDDKTILQPDLMIICDRSKFQNGRVYGAPDFVVEILSPSTRKKDMFIKLEKYKNAGVREYWIIDPKKKRVYVYEFEKESIPTLYTFEDKVPVGIFNGECEVDFMKIYSYVSFLYE